MTYPEGTRLVAKHVAGLHPQAMLAEHVASAPHRYEWVVRESAAKCAERMLQMLHDVLPLLEQGTTVIPEDDEAFGFDDYEDAIVDIKALIAEAEGRDAK